MAPSESTSIHAADRADQVLLGNLLELYVHDLSESFPFVEQGADGRFGYPDLDLYWSEPARRFPFLLKQGEKIAGFALVKRGSPAAVDPNVYDLAEFFVLRGRRRCGVGQRAAALLWNQLRGAWTVRCSESAPSALAFWSKAVTQFTHGDHQISAWSGSASQFRVFHFDSSLPPLMT